MCTLHSLFPLWLLLTRTTMKMLMSRDGGKWWSKDHHLVVVKILKNVDFSLKNVKKWWKKVIILFCKIIIIKKYFQFLYKFKTFYLQLSLKHNVHMINKSNFELSFICYEKSKSDWSSGKRANWNSKSCSTSTSSAGPLPTLKSVKKNY